MSSGAPTPEQEARKVKWRTLEFDDQESALQLKLRFRGSNILDRSSHFTELSFLQDSKRKYPENSGKHSRGGGVKVTLAETLCYTGRERDVRV